MTEAISSRPTSDTPAPHSPAPRLPQSRLPHLLAAAALAIAAFGATARAEGPAQQQPAAQAPAVPPAPAAQAPAAAPETPTAAAAPTNPNVATKQFAGWRGLCDPSLGMCRASLASETGLQALLIGRLPGSDGIAVGVVVPNAIADRERPIGVRVDGKRLFDLNPGDYAPFERPDQFWLTDPKTAAPLLAALFKGRSLRLEYIDVTGAPYDADFTLEGLDQLVAWTDERLAKKGAKREAAAPPGLAAAPAVTKAELIVRQGVPPRLVDRHMAASDCEAPNSPLLKAIKPVIGPLSKTAMLYGIPCTASGGNVSYRVWVVESGEIGGITPLYFAAFDPAFGWKGSDLVYNIAFDDKQARLVSTFRGRGGADCGSRGIWRWKDFAFAMDEFRSSSDCGADPDRWTRVYPAP